MRIPLISTENIRFSLILLELFVALFGTFYFRKYSKSPLKILLFILWYTFLNDIVGLTMQYVFKTSNNFIIYNFYQVIRFSALLWIYSRYVRNINNYKVITFFQFSYLFSFLINLYFEDFCKSYFLNTFIIGASLVTIAIIIYLFEILRSDKILFITKSLVFWVSFAHLIYFVPNVPFYIVRKYYSNSNTIPFIFIINYFLLLSYNSILISGFIWSKAESKE
ncbi:hypothetical protein DI487_11395 [Flavobacterium sediminis]|uniref:Uncharacterized protein n=1 Tax=Flavobacterium sediminis TaxID=2201181 RepID=A0A2U8QWH4_9FLAO|nr:hypothetical protein DI487_11395 [Flavobacterium sediminis]